MASQELINIIIKAVDEASSTAKKVDDSLRKIGDTGSKLSNIPGFDTLKSKLSSVASTLDDKLGGSITKAMNHFNNLKTRVSGAANELRSKMGSAVDGIRNKLSSLSNGANGVASAMNFLKGAVSMTVGMIGYDLVNSLMQTTRASLNARSSIQAFGSRLQMSSTEVSTFQQDLDKLQQTYKKIDMDIVGQQAMDMAYRLGLPKTALKDLTETSAIFTDAFVRNGRSSEDATLAMADAMDGEFKRLKEIGISQEDLMKNGWSGDINDKTSLIKGLNGALKEQHYDELAKNVDSLDDAWQVLSITLSNLIEAILVPLTPLLVQIITAFTNVVEAIKPIIGVFQGLWNALPPWIQDTIWAALLVIALYAIGTAIMSSVVPALAAATLAAIDFFMAMLANPLTWVLVALVAIALAIYEVGKAFGWWSDVGSMLDAVWAGLQRLWDAFINHPDVQAIISALSGAWQWLCDAVGQAWNAISDFFNLNTGGQFDVVRALIEGIGLAWNFITFPIRSVIGLMQMLWPYFQQFYETCLVPLGEFLGGAFAEAWTFVMGLLEQITPFVENLTQAWADFQSGQMDLPGLIMTVLTSLFDIYLTIMTSIIGAVLNFAWQLLSSALTAGSNFVNGIVTYISQLPGRFLSYLLQVAVNILNAGNQWVNNARNKANQLVTGVISFISQLPGRALSALLGVVSSIVSAGAQWISNANAQANSIVSGVVGILSGLPGRISSALSGVVNAIVSPFRQAYDSVVNVVNNIKNQVQEGLSAIGQLNDARGGDDARGSDILGIDNNYNGINGIITPLLMENRKNNTASMEDHLTIDVNEKITLDLANVPSSIDETTLIEMLQDKQVLSALTNNRVFQELDAKVKQRIEFANGRARGV